MTNFAAIVLLAFAGLALAQEPGRGAMPPGTSEYGTGAAEGAIKGGSIEPRERDALPDRGTWRCNQLSGTLREQCLRDLGASGGATRAPGVLPRPDPAVRDPRTAPPPQNPR